MAATILVKLDYGGSDGSPGSQDDVTSANVRFRTDDTNTQDLTNPIPIVTGQTKRSYWKHLYLYCSVAPVTSVDNVKFYTDGSVFGTGITFNVGTSFPTNNSGVPSSGYEVASGTIGDSGDEVVATHTGVSAKASAFDYTSGATLAVSISEAGALINAIGETTDYVVFQMDVIDTASPGTLTAETLTFQYDES